MIAPLARIKESLQGQFASVRIRGQGASSFLFVEQGGRAVELSWNGTSWWLEFWARSDAEDAPPVAERLANSEAEAAQAIKEWLIRD
jgi:hypothetical protein